MLVASHRALFGKQTALAVEDASCTHLDSGNRQDTLQLHAVLTTKSRSDVVADPIVGT